MNLELELIGESTFTKKLRKDIQHITNQQKNLLLKGERGAGKTTVAKLIDKLSGKKGNLVTLTPLTLNDIEMKEALKISPGISTVIIQEIEEFSFLHQVLIKKAIQSLPKKSTTGFIITTKFNLCEVLKNRKLIQDLHDILNKFKIIEIPSLNQRPEDIPLLVEHFIKNACQSIGARLKAIDINSVDLLVRHQWKDNITELKAIIEQAVFASNTEVIELPDVLVDEKTQLESILDNIDDRKLFSLDKSLSNLERTLIERALEIMGNNQVKAAKLLSVSDANLRYRLRKFKIGPPKR